MKIIPDNYKLIVRVYQYTWFEKTLQSVPINKRAEQITQFLTKDIESFATEKQHTIIHTDEELHVLRLLRHVREEVNQIKLEPRNLEFWFDKPDGYDMDIINPTSDGDLEDRVPGGFFNQRAGELF